MKRSNNTIVAKPTKYGGITFRSQLEARWAVFFDTVGISWMYEPQIFIVADGKYVPDFWFPELNRWWEVKGARPTLSAVNAAAYVAQYTKQPMLISWGNLAGDRMLLSTIYQPWKNALYTRSFVNGGTIDWYYATEYHYLELHNPWSYDLRMQADQFIFEEEKPQMSVPPSPLRPWWGWELSSGLVATVAGYSADRRIVEGTMTGPLMINDGSGWCRLDGRNEC